MTAIARHMTRQPWSVQLDDSVAVARQMLAQREIHHLPVLDGKLLVGIVTERDLALASNRVAATVEQVMTTVHRVDKGMPLEEVLEMMYSSRNDAVVVTDGDRVEGIFTAMDAVRVLHQRLRRHAA